MTADAPELVERATLLARQLGFPLDSAGGGASCCQPAVGRLLAMLAARSRRIGEIGTGAGYGTAWMVSAMSVDASLVTIELDHRLAVAVAELFAHDPRVRVIEGDASEIISNLGPFDLLFADGAGYGSDSERLRSLFPLLTTGGSIVVDDVTPVAALPEDSPFRHSDPKRGAFADDGSIWCLEIVAPDLQNSALVGTRIRP